MAKLSLSLIKQHVEKTYRGVKVQLHAVFTTTHKMEVSFTPRPLYSGEKTFQYLLDSRLNLHQGWSGRCEKLKNIFSFVIARDLYSSPSIIRIIKSRRMRWAGHVARMGRRGTRIGYWWESQRERGH
jgi:hypothetical protein